MTTRANINPRTATAIAAFLRALPATKGQIIRKSGLNHSTVSKLTKRFYRTFIRICGWAPHPVRGPEIPIYDLGAAPDALDSRERLTRKQIHCRYEERIKGTDAFDRRVAKRSSYWYEKKAKAKKNTWFGALPGANFQEGAAC